MRRFILFLLILIAACAAAVWFCPASLAFPYLVKPSETVKLSDLSGTIWNGHAGSLSVRGQALGQVDWHLHPWPLLQKHRNTDFTITGDGISAQGNLDKAGGDADFRDLTFHAPAALAAQVAHVSNTTFGGDVEGDIAHLALRSGAPTGGQGSLHWHKAALVAPTPVDLGEVEINFTSTSSDDISGNVKLARDTLLFAGGFKVTGSSSQIEWHDVHFHLPAQLAAPLSHVSNVALTGDVDGDVPRLVLINGAPSEGQGALHWHKAALTAPKKIDFGEADVKFASTAPGNFDGDMKLASDTLQFNGSFKTATPSLQMDWHDIHFHFPAQLATPLIHVPDITPSGDIEGTISRLQLHDLWPTAVQGKLNWRSAEISGATQAKLGDLEVAFSNVEDGSIIGVLNDLGGALKVDGTFTVTHSDYNVEMQLSARNGDAQVAEALHHVGVLQPDGSSILKTQGQVPALFK